jgi:hypothetical protein
MAGRQSLSPFAIDWEPTTVSAIVLFLLKLGDLFTTVGTGELCMIHYHKKYSLLSQVFA